MNALATILSFLIFFSPTANAEKTDAEVKALAQKLMKIQGSPKEYIPPEGFVQSADVAGKIAEAVLKDVKFINLKDEMPFRIKKENDIWIVEGKERKPCPTSDSNCFSFDLSPLHLEISAKDARIIRFYKMK